MLLIRNKKNDYGAIDGFCLSCNLDVNVPGCTCSKHCVVLFPPNLMFPLLLASYILTKLYVEQCASGALHLLATYVYYFTIL